MWVDDVDDVKVKGLGVQKMGSSPDVLINGVGDNLYKSSGV